MSEFIVFGENHISFMIIGTFLSFIFIISGFKDGNNKFGKSIAVCVIFLKLSEIFYCYYVYNMDIKYLLPLYLCDFTLVVAIIVMFNRSKFWFQFLYFWSPASFLAILTPDLYFDGFNLLNITFFALHFFICAATIYFLMHFNLYPTKKGIIYSFSVANLVAFPIYYLNNILETNYYFVNDTPPGDTLLDYFGQWPYYIFWTEIIYIVISLLLYFPFRKYGYTNNFIEKNINKKNSHKHYR